MERKIFKLSQNHNKVRSCLIPAKVQVRTSHHRIRNSLYKNLFKLIEVFTKERSLLQLCITPLLPLMWIIPQDRVRAWLKITVQKVWRFHRQPIDFTTRTLLLPCKSVGKLIFIIVFKWPVNSQQTVGRNS